MKGAKIIDYLGNNKFVVVLPEEEEWDGNPREKHITIAHDYVQISGPCDIKMIPNDKGEYPYQVKSGISNYVKSRASIQIGIREVKELLIPMLLESEYLQDERFKPRVHNEDDRYFKDYGLDKPRWKKGDEYPPYAYSGAIVRHNGMVYFRRKGETVYSKVTSSVFNDIKDHLNLAYNKYEKTELDERRSNK